MKVTAIIVGAGNGSRMGLGRNKLLIHVNGKTMIEHTLDKFYYHNQINHIIVVHSAEDESAFAEINAQKYDGNLTLVRGGITRSISVKNGLEKCPPSTEIVLIHDGARPFVSQDVIDRCIASTEKFGTGIASVPVSDTVGDLSGYRDEIVGHLRRDKMVLIQTPQGFLYPAILDAYRNANENINFTDDSSVYLKYIAKPRRCQGSPLNVKITYREDLSRFGKTPETLTRIGNGYDAHRFSEGRKLILGGVEIPHPMGLLGHSDADAVAHALMDSLLAAANLPNIGQLFPDTDASYRNVSSLKLLERVRDMLRQEGAFVVNVSVTVIAEQPKLSPHIPAMKAALAKALNIKEERVSVSATTTEGMGFTGRGEGIAASAVSLITYNN